MHALSAAWCREGQVFKALLRGVDEVALKVLKGQQDARTQKTFLKEIQLLKNARHPNIVLSVPATTSPACTICMCKWLMCAARIAC